MEELSLEQILNLPERDWKRISTEDSIPRYVLSEILLGGQSFRWFNLADSCWLGFFGDHVVILYYIDDHHLSWFSPTNLSETVFQDYLDLNRSYLAEAAQLPLNCDPVLARLADSWSALRILRQSPAEALLGFLCSSNKQILQIRRMLESLAFSWGPFLEVTLDKRPLHALPSFERIAELTESQLRASGLGYRSKYILNTARIIRDEPGLLNRIRSLDYAQAKDELKHFPGVGDKVADCVLLFGYQRWDAFPVDTWIEKILKSEYQLNNWNRVQLAQFARIHFGPYAGWVQQWFFAQARQGKSNSANSRL